MRLLNGYNSAKYQIRFGFLNRKSEFSNLSLISAQICPIFLEKHMHLCHPGNCHLYNIYFSLNKHIYECRYECNNIYFIMFTLDISSE